MLCLWKRKGVPPKKEFLIIYMQARSPTNKKTEID